MTKQLSTERMLAIAIELIECGYSSHAMNLIEFWGEKQRNPNPVIAKFLFPHDDNPRKYWLEYEPMLSDMRAEIAKLQA